MPATPPAARRRPRCRASAAALSPLGAPPPPLQNPADPTHTNLHIHGLHESPGLFAQTVPVRYRGGDNVLVQVPPGGQLYWESRVPRDHLPGMHWVRG